MPLAIRDQQMAAFREGAMREFKERTVERLRSFAPKHFVQPGEVAVRRAVDVGVERSFAYGLTAESAVQFYIEMMFVLGSGFDKDPMFPWAGQILNDRTISDQYQKTDRLYDETSDYRSRCLGDSNEYYYSALRRIQEEYLGAEVRRGSMPVDDYTAGAFSKMFPEKHAYLTDPLVRIVATRAAREGADHGIKSDQGSFVVGTLMLLLGCDVCRDPLHPWVGEALTQDNPLTPDERVRRLYEGASRALDHCLA